MSPPTVVQAATDEREAPSGAWLRQRRRGDEAVVVDVVSPHLVDRVTGVAVLESSGEPHRAAVGNGVHVGNRARQLGEASPGVVLHLEGVDVPTGLHARPVATE